MAAAAADTFQHGGILLAEAGTGTGKTLAYLVPAILSRRRVLISTGTKNLQDQIFFKDIPLLTRALDVPFTATYMKGRTNYLCLHRFNQVKSEPALDLSLRALLPRLDAWASATETGDRAELDDLPEDLSVWSDLTATSEQCLGTTCPQFDECFITRMRRRALESDLVIVNHHLLCADAAVRQSAFGEVIPSCACAVLDEAHQLEEVVTQYFGLSVSTHRLDELVRDGRRLVTPRPAQRRSRRARSGDAPPIDDADGRLGAALDRLELEARSFFARLGAFHAELSARSPRADGDDRVRLEPTHFEPLRDLVERLLGALGGLHQATTLLTDAPEDATTIGRRALEIAEELRFLAAANDPAFVYFLETRGRGLFLRAAPIDVSRIVRDLLLKAFHGAVLTSATLTVNRSFEYIKTRLGLAGAREIRLASEFDYARQAVLYLPARMPDPRSPAFADAAAREIIDILRRTKGRAFVLFTSYAMLRAVLARIERALPYPLLVQGTSPRSALLRKFRRTPNAVLLATASFWQGVDVIGDALSCVVIDKLPFASPSDPITSARIDAIRARGGSPFDEYQLPVAILTLQQGLGRLIRHRLDRGVLAVLDPRLRTKAYGRQFLDSLPPAPITTDLDVLGQFVREPPDP